VCRRRRRRTDIGGPDFAARFDGRGFDGLCFDSAGFDGLGLGRLRFERISLGRPADRNAVRLPWPDRSPFRAVRWHRRRLDRSRREHRRRRPFPMRWRRRWFVGG
jgi:hypothetical protein